MNIGEMLLGEEITERYPRRGDMQLFRLEAVAEFTCSRCMRAKKAWLVAVCDDSIICNDCYGRSEVEVEGVVHVSLGENGHAGPSAPEGKDLSRVVVEETNQGFPFSVVSTGQAVGWKLYVRAENLVHGTCPVPVEIVDRIPRTPLNIALVSGGNLTLVQSAKRVHILDYQSGARLQLEGDQPFLTGISWHPFVLPGTRVAMRWDQRARTRLHIAYTRLSKPVIVAGTIVRYAYNPRIMTRDLAATDVRANRAEELVLITLRELGYLDERGRALLPEPALIRNSIERAEPGQASRMEIKEAIQSLQSRKLLTWEWGSLGAGDRLHYPARAGEDPVELLCYTPAVCEVDQEVLQPGGHGATAARAHRVAGHLMRIGHLGKEASAEARAAYRYDHQRAGLAGPHELPRGYTYVREHERGE
ncbi:hypothetical protein ACLQ18_18515 [Streptomyces sp. DT193]|uniref:hypothetical protein n=1 Tax=Streptomyces sp. DT193 TaxID=3393418 RepID=UPI003CEA3C0F